MLILVRHGRTAANAAGLLQGRIDLPLDELGQRQAARIAEAVGPVDRVISSPLVRARQTALTFGQAVEIDPRWVEIDYGVLDGIAISEVPAATWQRWRSDPDFVPGGGESHADLYARVLPACEALLEESRRTDIVVVSHVSPIKAAIGWALGLSRSVAWRCFLEQASISRVGADGHGPLLRSFNETWHLAGL